MCIIDIIVGPLHHSGARRCHHFSMFLTSQTHQQVHSLLTLPFLNDVNHQATGNVSRMCLGDLQHSSMRRIWKNAMKLGYLLMISAESLSCDVCVLARTPKILRVICWKSTPIYMTTWVHSHATQHLCELGLNVQMAIQCYTYVITYIYIYTIHYNNL